MTIEERAHAVRTREDLVAFIAALRDDYRTSDGTSANADLASFLDRMSGWSSDLEGHYTNLGEALGAVSPWRVLADILMAARIYE